MLMVGVVGPLGRMLLDDMRLHYQERYLSYAILYPYLLGLQYHRIPNPEHLATDPTADAEATEVVARVATLVVMA